jgi:hypothetical protein
MPSAISPPPALTAYSPPAHRPPAHRDPAVRAVAAIGLITVGIIHALQLPGQVEGVLWLTAGFGLLAIVGPAAGLWLLAGSQRLAWPFGGLTCLLAAGGYLLTRSVPVPGDTADVGNWLEPMGVAAVLTESVVVILAALVLVSIRQSARAAAQRASWPPARPGAG